MPSLEINNPLVYIIVTVITTVGIILAAWLRRAKPKLTSSSMSNEQLHIEIDEIKERLSWLEGRAGKNT